MPKQTKPSTWGKIRKFFNDIHLWVGLISGLIIIVVCLSGTIYVYHTELEEMAAPHLYEVEIPTNAIRLPAEEIIYKVKEVAGGDVVAITIPDNLERTYQLNIRKEGEQSRFGTTYFVNPYSGEVVGDSNEKTAMAEFLRTMFSLHRWLLLDKIEAPLIGEVPNRKLGSYITGSATILFTIGVITGLIIWFPRKIRDWKKGLKIKWGGSWKRTNHDLHNSLAFYFLIILFLMGVTGPQWSFPWYRAALQKSLGTYEEREERGRGDNKEGRELTAPEKHNQSVSLAPLSIAAYLSSADMVLPYEGDVRISLPQNVESPLEISKKRKGFFAPAASDKIVLDASTAEVISVEIFRDKPFNERVAGSIKALHMGDVYGSFSKLIYFFACLVATSLPITGTLIWLNKMKKKGKPAKSKTTAEQRPIVA